MSYKITVRVHQTNANAWFHIVEQTVWHYANGGTWSESDGKQILTMGGSGTSGVIRFQSDATDERFTVALGVHNYKRWCDVVTNLPTNQTGLVINPEYYTEGERARARERQLASYNVSNAKGRNIAVNYTKAEGNDLEAVIIIG